MKVALLVPRRDDNGHRDRIWAACKARWQALHPDWDISEGYHTDGPFNRSAAINLAAEQAGDWDVAVVIDSDIALRPEQAEEAVRTAHATGRVTWGHTQWWGMSRTVTDAVLLDPSVMLSADWKPSESAMKKNPISWSCFIAIPRKAWEVIGGFDERFKGWGWEDMAFQCIVRGIADEGRHPELRMDGPVWHFWHPRSPGLGKSLHDVNGIVSQRLGRRYMLALRRDHELHDRPTAYVDVNERQRDIANLVRDDKRLERQARAMKLPDWSNWWPTLEELRDHREPTKKVGLIVHSGGPEHLWPERKEYLLRSLISLNERVKYPWTRKVIFSDWGQNSDLEVVAKAHGFTVEGPAENVGYTQSMIALWEYIKGLPDTHLFVTEDDFTYDRSVPVERMVDALDANPRLVQMALLRNPIADSEKQEGTILGYPPGTFTQKRDGDVAYLEHFKFFTCNPSVIRRSLTERPWPNTPHSEAVYGKQMLRRGNVHSALWGSGEQWVTHIGDVRTGGPY